MIDESRLRSRGFIPLYRTMTLPIPEGGCPLWGQPRKLSDFEAWIWLEFRARAEPIGFDLPEGKRLEIAAFETPPLALRSLAEEWRWSVGRVRRFLARLTEMGRISAGQKTSQGLTYRVAPVWIHGGRDLADEGEKHGSETPRGSTREHSAERDRKRGGRHNDGASDRHRQTAGRKAGYGEGEHAGRDALESPYENADGDAPEHGPGYEEGHEHTYARASEYSDDDRDGHSQAAEKEGLTQSGGTGSATDSSTGSDTPPDTIRKKEKGKKRKPEFDQAEPGQKGGLGRLSASQQEIRKIEEVFERHGARPPERGKLGAFAKILREYRDRLGETEGLAGLLRDLEALGAKLAEGSRYVLACLRGNLEQDRAGRARPARATYTEPPNPFQPPDPRRNRR